MRNGESSFPSVKPFKGGGTLLSAAGSKKGLQYLLTHTCFCYQKPLSMVSITLSPTLTLFLEPHGKLYLQLQQVLSQLQIDIDDPLPPAKRRRPGPAKPKHGIPSMEWPTVLRRVADNKEPLRKVADDYGVSHETIRRTVQKAQKQNTK